MPLAEEDRTVNEAEVSALTAALDLSYQILAKLIDGQFISTHIFDGYEFLNLKKYYSCINDRQFHHNHILLNISEIPRILWN